MSSKITPDHQVHHVHTNARVAAMLGEDENWLQDVAIEMDQEDGLIWVYGPNDCGSAWNKGSGALSMQRS